MNRGLKKFGISILSIMLVLNSLAFIGFAKEVEENSISSSDVSWFDIEDQKDSYTITTAAQLIGLSQILQDEDCNFYEFENVTIKLGNDIILNDVTAEEWTANAVEWKNKSKSGMNNPFKGTFDGNDYSIIGLYSTDGGLFANVSGATIQNLTIDYAVITTENTQVGAVTNSANTSSTITNCKVKNSIISGGIDTGGIAGSSLQATITDCQVINTAISGPAGVGGVSGTSGVISNCTVDDDCTVSGGTDVGGITGDIKKSITNCINSATVSGTDCLGGIAGLYSGGTSVAMTECTNNGSVSSDDADFVGGILGSTTSHGLTISKCVNNAPISGDTNVAGIAGMIYTSTTISDCESNGAVKGKKNVAGIVGNSYLGGNKYEAGKPNSITGCTVSAEISGTENVGGLVGSNTVNEDESKDDTSIQKNILTPSSSVNGQTNVGALIGNNVTDTDTGTIKNNFWPEAAGAASGTGAGSSSTSMESTIMTTNSAYDADGNLKNTISMEEGEKTITNLSEAISEIIGGDDIPDALKATATFNNSGHGTAPEAQEVVIGTKISLPTMSKDGYWTFLNWTADNTTYDAGTEYTVTKDVTFTANWRNDKPSSNGSTTTKTNTTTNKDGSTTTTETKSDGTKVETTTNTDGSTTKTETKTETRTDGSSVTTEVTTTKTDGTKTEVTSKVTTAKDGTTTKTETAKTTDASGSTGTTTTVTDASGATTVTAEATVSEKAVETAQKENKAITVPVEVKATTDVKTAPTVEIKIEVKSSGSTDKANTVKVEVPVTNVDSGTVAVIVKADGTEEIIKTTVPTENGVAISVEGSVTIKVVDNSKTFEDTTSHWSKDEVNFVASREIFNGVGNNDFGVSAPMTRGMVNTVLARLSGEDTEGGANWYDKGNEWAVKNGVSDGTNPTGDVTREQLATMLYRYAGSPAVTGTLSFTDAENISNYARSAMLWASQIGIIGGMGDGSVTPAAGAERAQVAAMLARYIKFVG